MTQPNVEAPLLGLEPAHARTTATLMAECLRLAKEYQRRLRNGQDPRGAARELGDAEAALSKFDSGGTPAPVDQDMFNRAVGQAELGNQQSEQGVADKRYMKDDQTGWEGYVVFGQSAVEAVKGKYLGARCNTSPQADKMIDFIKDPNSPADRLAALEVTSTPVAMTARHQKAREQAREQEQSGATALSRVAGSLDMNSPVDRLVARDLENTNVPGVQAIVEQARGAHRLQQGPVGKQPATPEENSTSRTQDVISASRDMLNNNAGPSQQAPPSGEGPGGPAVPREVPREDTQYPVFTSDEEVAQRAEQIREELRGLYPRKIPWDSGTVTLTDRTQIRRDNVDALDEWVRNNAHNMDPANSKHCETAAILYDAVNPDEQQLLTQRFNGLEAAMGLQTTDAPRDDHERAVAEAQNAQAQSNEGIATQRQAARSQMKTPVAATQHAEQQSAEAAAAASHGAGPSPQKTRKTQTVPNQDQAPTPS